MKQNYKWVSVTLCISCYLSHSQTALRVSCCMLYGCIHVKRTTRHFQMNFLLCLLFHEGNAVKQSFFLHCCHETHLRNIEILWKHNPFLKRLLWLCVSDCHIFVSVVYDIKQVGMALGLIWIVIGEASSTRQCSVSNIPLCFECFVYWV